MHGLMLCTASPCGCDHRGLCRWEPGSYVWISVKGVANPVASMMPPPFKWESVCYHPITISSPPVAANGSPADSFTLHIKAFNPPGGGQTWSKVPQSSAPAAAATGSNGVTEDICPCLAF